MKQLVWLALTYLVVLSLAASFKISIDDEVDLALQDSAFHPGDEEARRAWETFLVNHKGLKIREEGGNARRHATHVYGSAEEAEYRFSLFKANLEAINNFNERSGQSVNAPKLAVNRHADLSPEEWRQIVNSHGNPNRHRLHVPPSPPDSSGSTTPAATIYYRNPDPDDKSAWWLSTMAGYLCKSNPPASWNYENVVGPINEGEMGSAEILVTIEAIDDGVLITHGQTIAGSGQELIDCVGEGHYPADYFAWILKNGGIDSEETYPYTGQKGPCKAQPAQAVAKLAAYVQSIPGNETDLQCAVAFYQPVTVCVDASHTSFEFYSSGIYYEPSCSTSQLDHCMLVTGYGSQDGQDYWIVENEWGVDWGMDGYIWMARNRNNNCGIATEAVFPIIA